MDGSVARHLSGEAILGEAVVGSGQCLAFTPCHQLPVRLAEADAVLPNAVCCPRDGGCWTLRFVKDGVDWVAVWTPQPPATEGL